MTFNSNLTITNQDNNRKQMIKAVNFFVECIKTFQSTGCLFPSSPWAADEMTKELEGKRAPMKIIEVGAGTGPISIKILDKLRKDDFLVICELNPSFFEILKEKITHHENFGDNVKLICGPIQDYNENHQFDFIVCSLPFLNFTVDLAKSIFNKIKEISHKDTTMVFYEYIAIKDFRKKVLKTQRVIDLDEYLSAEFTPRMLSCSKVWMNISPIKVKRIGIHKV